MTTQSTRRSPYCRIYSPCSRITKIRRLWYITPHHNFKSNNKNHSISFYYVMSMRHDYNQFNLLTTDRPKIINCLFISQPYSTSHHSNPYTNTMEFYRCHGPNNCTWLNIINIILSCKFELRTHSQPNNTISTRASSFPTSNSHLMIIS